MKKEKYSRSKSRSIVSSYPSVKNTVHFRTVSLYHHFFIVEQWSGRYPSEHVQIVRYRFARRFCGWRTYIHRLKYRGKHGIGLNASATVIYPSMTSKPATSAAPLRSLSSSRVLCRGCVLILLFRQLYRIYMISTGRQGQKQKQKQKKKRNER